MATMRIGLTYDLQHDPHDERQAEFDPPGTIEALCCAIEDLGHHVVRLGNAFDLLAPSLCLSRMSERQRFDGAKALRHSSVRTDLRKGAGLASTTWMSEVDVVFNIAEGSHGRCREAWVPNLLELLKVAYVGSDPLALSLGLDKATSKRLASACGILTPRGMVVDNPQTALSAMPLAFPVIVKPRYEGSGVGIDEGAVVHHREALLDRMRWLFERWPEPMVVEEFIPAGELTVCLIGNDPPTAYPAIQRSLDPATRLSCHVLRHATPSAWEAPLELTEELDAKAREIALVMFEALGCRDMARVDLRVDDAGAVYFLEINPLPSFDPAGSFGLLAEHIGMTYSQLIGTIIGAAWSRITFAKQKSLPGSLDGPINFAQQNL